MQLHSRLSAALLTAMLGGVAAVASAAPPGPRMPPGLPMPPTLPGNAALAVIEGQVQRLLVTPYGEPNGLRFVDGTVVLLPPHLAVRLTGVVAVGDRVRAIGLPASGGALRAQALVNLATGGAVDEQGEGPPRPPAPPSRPPLQQYAVQGVIDVVLHGPRGEANGVILADGAIIYFRPDLVGFTLAPGLPFAAAGIGTRSAAGLSIEAISAAAGKTDNPTNSNHVE